MATPRVRVRVEYRDGSAAVFACVRDCTTRDEAEVYGRLVAVRNAQGIWHDAQSVRLAPADAARMRGVPPAPPTPRVVRAPVVVEIPLDVWMALPIPTRTNLRALGFAKGPGCFRGVVRAAEARDATSAHPVSA